MKRTKFTWQSFIIAIFLSHELSAANPDQTWVGLTSDDLNTASNWQGNQVPIGIATFNSDLPPASFSPEATSLFQIANIFFSSTASDFSFFFHDGGVLKFTGIGISGTNTDTFIRATNDTGGSLNTAQLFFSPSPGVTGASLGNASLRIFNGPNSSIQSQNAAQISLADSDSGNVAPITAGDNVSYSIQNAGSIIGSDEAAQVFLKGSSFTVGDNFQCSVGNSSFFDNTNDVTIYAFSNSDSGQIVFDAGQQTANLTAGDNANIFVLNGGYLARSLIFSTNNNAGQIIFDGYLGRASCTLGDNAVVAAANVNDSLILNSSVGNDAGQMILDGNDGVASFSAGDNSQVVMSILNNAAIQGLGFDTGQIVIDGDGGTASFSLGNSSSVILTSASAHSLTILSGSDGNDAGQIVVDGNNGIASFAAGNNAVINISNAVASSIVSESSTAGHDAGQIVVDGNKNDPLSAYGNASFSLGNNSSLFLINAANCSITSSYNTGQFVVDPNLGTATVTFGNNNIIDIVNNGQIANTRSGSIAGQMVFNGSTSGATGIVLDAGANTRITATLEASGTIANAGLKHPAQIYFNDTTIIGNPLISAINLSSNPVNGIVFDGTTTAPQANIALQNSSLVINTQGHPPFAIQSLAGDSASLVKLNQDLVINTVFGAQTTFAGVILDATGTNDLTINGTGTQGLSGDNTYKGITTVNDAKLILNGSVLNDVVVNRGVLAGTGTVKGSVVLNIGSVIDPGLRPEIGTFNILKNYTQAAGTTYLVRINGMQQSSRLSIGEDASIAGTLSISSPDGTYSIGRPYTLLTAGRSLNGVFDQVILLNPYLNYDIIYDRDPSVQLLLSTDFLSWARTSNQRGVAEQIDANIVPVGSQEFMVNNLLSLPVDRLPRALDAMSGEQYAYLVGINQYSDYRFGRRIFDAVRNLLVPYECSCSCPCPRPDACSCSEIDTWMAFEAEYGRLGNERIAQGYKEKSLDFSFGLQCDSNCLLYGAALNFESSKATFNLNGTNTLNNVQGSLYGVYRRPKFYVFSDFIFGEGFSHFKRHIHFADLRETAHSSPKFTHAQLYAESGFNICWRKFLIQPFVGADSNYVKAHGFHEHKASSVNLAFGDRDIWSENVYLGTHLLSSYRCLKLNADLIYQRRFGSLGNTIHPRFAEFGDEFAIQGAGYARNGFIANLRAGANLLGADFYVEFSTELWDHRSTFAGSIGLSRRW